MVKESAVQASVRKLLEEHGLVPDLIVRVDPDMALWVDKDGVAHTTYITVDGKKISIDTVSGFEF